MWLSSSRQPHIVCNNNDVCEVNILADISIVKPTISQAEAIGDICARGWRQTVAGKLSEAYQQQNI